MTADGPGPTGAQAEIELRLRVAAADLPRITDLPLVRAMQAGPVRVVRQVTTYFDTPSMELAAGGLALRHRIGGDGAATLGIKTFGTPVPGSAIPVRTEIDMPVPQDADLSALLHTAFADRIPASSRDRLQPLFRTEVERTLVLLRFDPDVAVEMAVDAGWIVAESAKQSIAEVELELKTGRTDDLLRMAAAIHRHVPVAAGLGSKAHDGFALVLGRPVGTARIAEEVRLQSRIAAIAAEVQA